MLKGMKMNKVVVGLYSMMERILVCGALLKLLW